MILAAAAAFPSAATASRVRAFEWTGTALGADASILLYADEKKEARAAIGACVAEIERLEKIFSLYRPASEISRLNRTGNLAAASHDMVRLLQLSRRMHVTTQGLFDPTVQPLWEFYRDWYAADPRRRAPCEGEISPLLLRVGMDKISVGGGAVICEPGTRITLNGIAQGYITDRVAGILRRRGWKNVLIDLGEVRALDARPDSSPWQIRIRETGQSVPLADAALATSSGGALAFDSSGTATHIFSPLTGRGPALWHAVTVQHTSAAVADALSTALAAATPGQLKEISQAEKEARIWAAHRDGTIIEYGA